MPQAPTLDDLTARLEAQNAELASAAELADTMPAGITLDESFVQAFDDVIEPPAAARDHVLCFGIRA